MASFSLCIKYNWWGLVAFLRSQSFFSFSLFSFPDLHARALYRVVSCRVVSCRTAYINARKGLYVCLPALPDYLSCHVRCLNPMLCTAPLNHAKNSSTPTHPAKANTSKITTLPANLFCLVLINKNVTSFL